MSRYHRFGMFAGVLVLFWSLRMTVAAEPSQNFVATSSRQPVGEKPGPGKRALAGDSDRPLVGPVDGRSADSRTGEEMPLLSLAIPRQWISQFAERTIDQQLPVEDSILGMPITGTSHLIARTKIRLLPDSDAWKFEFLLSGTAQSQTVGSQSYVEIHSRSSTLVEVHKCVGIGFGAFKTSHALRPPTRIARPRASCQNRVDFKA